MFDNEMSVCKQNVEYKFVQFVCENFVDLLSSSLISPPPSHPKVAEDTSNTSHDFHKLQFSINIGTIFQIKIYNNNDKNNNERGAVKS